MNRIRVVLVASMLLLGGCVHQTKTQFTRHYALGGSAPVSTGQSTAPNPDGRILQVSRIIVPEWLAGAAMYYRLDYRQDGRLSAYANSDWIAPPATLLEPIVEDAIAAGGAWRAVLGPRNPAMADASLHLQLDDFSQAFAQPDQSTGVIDATATLIDHHDDHVIDQKHFHIEVAAPTPDAQGGVKALRDASRKLAAQLQAWLEAASRRPDQAAPAADPAGRVRDSACSSLRP